MATNIQMNILQSNGTYEILYPQTLGSLVSGAVSSATSATTAGSCTGNAATATTLATARTIQTNLSSTSSASFNGSANITPGVTGTLPIANGGTGGTTASAGVYNLTYPLTSRTAANINSYASSTYVPCYYGSTGYKFPISNLLTYFQNNLSSDGATIESGTYTVAGGTTYSIPTSISSPKIAFLYTWQTSSISLWGNTFNQCGGIFFNNEASGNVSAIGLFGLDQDKITMITYLIGTLTSSGLSITNYTGNKFFQTAGNKITYSIIG